MRPLLASFAKDESGATAIEYACIAGIISIAIVAAVSAIGGNISSRLSPAEAALK